MRPLVSRSGRDRVALVVILGVAALMRTWELQLNSLTMDEIAGLSLARLNVEQIMRAPDSFPPVYPLLLSVWLRIVPSAPDSRWLSVLFGVAAVAAVWALARTLAGRRVAAWSAAILALLPFHVWHSQEARCYAFYVLLAACCWWLFLLARESGRPLHWAGFVVATIAGLFTHYHFAAVLAGPVALAGLDRYRARLPGGAWVALLALAPFGVLWVILLRADLAYAASYPFLSNFGPVEAAYTIWTLLTGYAIGPSVRDLHTLTPPEAIASILPWIPIVGFGAGYLALAGIRRLQDRRRLADLLLLGFVPFVIVGVVSEFAGVGYKVRHVAFLAVPVAVWLGAGIPAASRTWLGRIAIACLLFVFISARANQTFVEDYRTEDVRKVASILDECPEPVPVLVSAHYMAEALQYYSRSTGRFRPMPTVMDSLDAAVAGSAIATELGSGAEFWVAYTRPFHGDPHGLLLELLRADFEATEIVRVPGVVVYRARTPGSLRLSNSDVNCAVSAADGDRP